MRPESSALNITDKIDALATALRAAGISDEQSAGLLASAATAAMHAVVLDAVLDELQAPQPSQSVGHAPVQPVRIAA